MAATGRRKRSWGGPKAEINITPLIDVLLVLIVIFLVIAPVAPQGLPVEIPKPPEDQSRRPPEEVLVLRLHRDGGIRLNSEELQLATVLPRLKEVFSRRGDRTIFLQADDEILFNEVAQLIDTARGAGADRVGLLTSQVMPR